MLADLILLRLFGEELALMKAKRAMKIPSFMERCNTRPDVVWNRDGGPRIMVWHCGAANIYLDGRFTAEELRAMAEMMESGE